MKNSGIPEGTIAVAATDPTPLIILRGSTLLKGVAGTPVVLADINSSVLEDPLPDGTPVCEETDNGLESAEFGVLMG